MKNILVTGGAGFIGSHACKVLRAAGFNPITFDNLSTGWRDAVKFGPFEHGDLLKKSDLDRVFKMYAPMAVRAVTVVCLQTFYEIAERFRCEWEWFDFSFIAPIDKRPNVSII